MVALARALEGDALVAHQDLAVDVAAHLVAGHARVVVGGPDRLPLEVDPEGDPVAPLAAVGLARVVEGDGERLEAERPVLERRLAVARGPQPVAADLQADAGQRHLVVPHQQQRPVPAHQHGPVPGHAAGWGRARGGRSRPSDPSAAAKSKYHDSLKSGSESAVWFNSSAGEGIVLKRS